MSAKRQPPHSPSRIKASLSPKRPTSRRSTPRGDRMLPTPDRRVWSAYPDTAKDEPEDTNRIMYDLVLQNELLGAKVSSAQPALDRHRLLHSMDAAHVTQSPRSMLQYSAPEPEAAPSPFSLSPLSATSQSLLRSPQRPPRKIPKLPYKVLDAPELQDDFYLNLVDWAPSPLLAVALAASVYMWSPTSSQVTKLCELEDTCVTSVRWTKQGGQLALGDQDGGVYLYDSTKLKRVAKLEGHSDRVAALACTNNIVASGSRDHSILLHDLRQDGDSPVRTLTGHSQEVCGLQWSPDDTRLASGGNDNNLMLWEPMAVSRPQHIFREHKAAVKAIAWSPHKHGLLASGGGTSDKSIRFWNTLTHQPLQVVDTGAQVCNIGWSRYSNELVSTHGYAQNAINVWQYPSMNKLATLTGHTYRVLYLALSPDGKTIVTGAGDETLRFWQVFPERRQGIATPSALQVFSSIR
eukprot:TRINITY_DN6394_c0_g1_i2.p1 TRINITY_DN6394_c0_g1~~TRINITY_DN6394_c0_g1_i2.p1  ORF type:complete len:464 (+),score=75.89 TRINITY_DN6394_c0_g1_i2:109-1500(+)